MSRAISAASGHELDDTAHAQGRGGIHRHQILPRLLRPIRLRSAQNVAQQMGVCFGRGAGRKVFGVGFRPAKPQVVGQ